MFRTRLMSLALAALPLLVPGCGTDHAGIRVVHGSPDAPNVDVAVDGKIVVTNLAYTNLEPASGYITVTAGSRRFEVLPTGTTTDLVNSTIDFGGQKDYTVIVSGCVDPQTHCNQQSPSSTVAAVLKTDDNSAPSGGNLKLRLVHGSPSGAGHLDIYLVAPGTDITNLSPTIPALAYQQASDYQNLQPTSSEVIITVTGDVNKSRIIDQTYPFNAGQIRTLIIMDVAGGGTISPTPLELSDLN